MCFDTVYLKIPQEKKNKGLLAAVGVIFQARPLEEALPKQANQLCPKRIINNLAAWLAIVVFKELSAAALLFYPSTTGEPFKLA